MRILTVRLIDEIHLERPFLGVRRVTDELVYRGVSCSVNYEEVYLKIYESMQEAKTGIGSWIDSYISRRTHQTLKTTPDIR